MANAGKTVIVAALDGTFQRKPFGPILNLVPMAESVVKLKAVCMVCFKDAAFSKRLGSETEVSSVTWSLFFLDDLTSYAMYSIDRGNRRSRKVHGSVSNLLQPSGQEPPHCHDPHQRGGALHWKTAVPWWDNLVTSYTFTILGFFLFFVLSLLCHKLYYNIVTYLLSTRTSIILLKL